jgi:hypothetical protein
MIGFIDDHRAAYGVEPICRVLPIPSAGFPPAVQVEPLPPSPRAPTMRTRQSASIWASLSYGRNWVMAV